MLVLAVLLPSAIKLTHAFNHHTHEVCEFDDNSSTHFHQSDLDCDFYTFKLNKNQFFVLSQNEEQIEIPYSKLSLEHYVSLHNYQQLSRYLRGPPQLVSST